MKPVRFDTRYLNGKGSFGEMRGISNDFIIGATNLSINYRIRENTYQSTNNTFSGFDNFLTWNEI